MTERPIRNTPHQSNTPHQAVPDLRTEPTLPSLPSLFRRVQTLEVMLRSIDACAQALDRASATFRDSDHLTAQDMRCKVFGGRQSVCEALDSLRPIKNLVELGPDHISNIARCLGNVTKQLDKIDRVSLKLTETERLHHTSRILASLSLACMRAACQLENDLGVPIKATRDEFLRVADLPDTLSA